MEKHQLSISYESLLVVSVSSGLDQKPHHKDKSSQQVQFGLLD